MTHKPGPPESSPPRQVDLSAEDSGSFQHIPEELTPLLPLLRKSVEHMRQGNSYQKDATLAVADLSRRIGQQVKLLWVGATLGAVLFAGLIVSVREQRDLAEQLRVVASQLVELSTKTGEVKTELDSHPKISVVPADSTDPSARPTLIVEPQSSTSVAIPLDLPPPKP